MKKIKYVFEALIIYFIFFIIKIIGFKLSRKIFPTIFKKIGPFFKSETIIDQNIDRISRGLASYDKDSIKDKMWENYGNVFIEYLFLSKFKTDNSHINIKGKQYIEKIIKNNETTIFISGHFANFEFMSMELTKMKIKLATIYRPLNNFFLNPFMEHLRKQYICKNQIKKGIPGIRQAVEYINKNYSIALMVDQRVSEGKLLPFFGEDAWTTTLPAQLALKYKCNITPISIYRIDDKFEMEILKPIEVTNMENNEENKIKISSEINKTIEIMIKKDPSQWILTHNRWK